MPKDTNNRSREGAFLASRSPKPPTTYQLTPLPQSQYLLHYLTLTLWPRYVERASFIYIVTRIQLIAATNPGNGHVWAKNHIREPTKAWYVNVWPRLKRVSSWRRLTIPPFHEKGENPIIWPDKRPIARLPLDPNYGTFVAFHLFYLYGKLTCVNLFINETVINYQVYEEMKCRDACQRSPQRRYTCIQVYHYWSWRRFVIFRSWLWYLHRKTRARMFWNIFISSPIPIKKFWMLGKIQCWNQSFYENGKHWENLNPSLSCNFCCPSFARELIWTRVWKTKHPQPLAML